MDIHIDSSSDVPIRRQLTEQIVFLIAIERLKDGDVLPSVRELARRLKIHRNTVSEAYQDLVRRNWLRGRRGSRLTVLSRTKPHSSATLDDLINQTIARARENGYSLQALRERVRERLLTEPPDHLLVVEQDAELRELIREELRLALPWKVEACSREDLAASSGLAIGALVVTPLHALGDVGPLCPADRPAAPLRYSHADAELRAIRALKKPSVIAVVSASRLFLGVARGVMASAIGNRHELCEIHIGDDSASTARGADLVFCDSLAKKRLRLPGAIHYRLLLSKSIEDVEVTMKSYRS
jgi:DNA-binding transcriptional regulator YhcF (GntR family)